MYTQCPQCRTIFEISEDALQASLGIVRCGRCAERFDALRTLSDTLPAGPEAALPQHDPDVHAPILTSAVSTETVQAAAMRPREAASETAPSDDPPAAAQPDEAWFDALAGDRARALIADAAGIPPEAVPGDPAWQLIDLPVQTRFTELDIIPMASAVPTMEPGEPDALTSAPANIQAAASEPFTQAWGLDIPEAGLTDPAAVEHATGDEAGLPAANDSLAEFADDTGAAVPLAAAEVESDPDSWLPEDQLRADDVLAPDAGVEEEEGHAWAEPQGEPRDDEAEPAGVAAPVYVPPRRRRIRRSDWLSMVGGLGFAALVLWLASQYRRRRIG